MRSDFSSPGLLHKHGPHLEAASSDGVQGTEGAARAVRRAVLRQPGANTNCGNMVLRSGQCALSATLAG